jgi:hypothetical protein
MMVDRVGWYAEEVELRHAAASSGTGAIDKRGDGPGRQQSLRLPLLGGKTASVANERM